MEAAQVSSVILTVIWIMVACFRLPAGMAKILARCDKFSHASNFAGSAFSGGNIVGGLAGNMVGRWFTRG